MSSAWVYRGIFDATLENILTLWDVNFEERLKVRLK